jgi:hypothetical protein
VPRVGHVKDNPKRGEKESDERMETKKIMAIFAILMIALGIAGYAYAHWNATITINGTIKTGTFHLTPSFDAEVNDAKKICTVTWSIKDDTLNVIIDKAYPCITVTGKFDLKNDGTVPAGLYKWVIDVPGAGVGGPWTIFDANDIEHSVIKPSMTEAEVEAALKTFVEQAAHGAVTVTVDFAGANFWQIDPGANPTLHFTIHFEEALLQGYTAQFTMTLEYWNWNEVGYLR